MIVPPMSSPKDEVGSRIRIPTAQPTRKLSKYLLQNSRTKLITFYPNYIINVLAKNLAIPKDFNPIIGGARAREPRARVRVRVPPRAKAKARARAWLRQNQSTTKLFHITLKIFTVVLYKPADHDFTSA